MTIFLWPCATFVPRGYNNNWGYNQHCYSGNKNNGTISYVKIDFVKTVRVFTNNGDYDKYHVRLQINYNLLVM